MSDDRPFVIERAGPKGRIRLNAAAKYWAQEYGMSLTEMDATCSHRVSRQENKVRTGRLWRLTSCPM